MTKITDDQITLHLGGKLRELREAQGIAGPKLAAQVGITHQQLYKAENGINTMTGARLYRLAHALGVSPAAFFAGLPATEMVDAAS